MKKIRGFKLGKRLIRLTKRVLFRRCRNPRGYSRLTQPEPVKECKTLSRIMNWGRKLTVGARSICQGRTGSGYGKLGREPWCNEKAVTVPKGHLAVYVGQKDGDFHRVLVPVIYVNHPLFGELLREAEEEFGFCQEGGIMIPCGFSDFEKVQTRIRDSPDCGRKT